MFQRKIFSSHKAYNAPKTTGGMLFSNRPNLAKLGDGLDCYCYGWRQQNKKQLSKNRGILKPSWAFVETNNFLIEERKLEYLESLPPNFAPTYRRKSNYAKDTRPIKERRLQLEEWTEKLLEEARDDLEMLMLVFRLRYLWDH